MPVAIHSEKVRELVDEHVEVEQIATGFVFTEGPIWMADGSLHLSDIPADKRWRWHPSTGAEVVREPSNKCNGMTRGNDGSLIVCEHVTSSVVRETPAGKRETIATHWSEGEQLGVIEVPELTANVNWGEDGWRSLFIAASTSVYRVRMKVAGNRLGYMD